MDPKVAKVVKNIGEKNKKQATQQDSELLDITDQCREEEMKMCSASEDTWSNPAHKEMASNLKQAKLGVVVNDTEGNKTPLGKRVPQLSRTQAWPFVGNSTMKRVITETPSTAVYNPFEPATEGKIDELTDWLQYHEDKNTLGSKTELEFFKKLITPRDEWPTKTYGWLNDEHMAAAMTVFRRRSMREPSPFHSPRIAFLDPHFVMTWTDEYARFDAEPRNFLFRDFYLNAMNGLTPCESPTHKKWVIDVDHLYLALHVHADHWVALDVNLIKEKIFVYDSIIKHQEDKDIVEACKPFSKMLPYMLNILLPPDIRKRSKKQFGVHRYKTIPKNKSVSMPQNENPGDCGVYTLKYIECLALGVSLEGLCDSMIQSMRVKLAVDIMDEVPEEKNAITNP